VALADEAVTAAPAGLAASVAVSVLASPAASLGISATLVKLLVMTKLKAGILGALVGASLASSLLIHSRAGAKLDAEADLLRQQTNQLAQAEADHERLSGLAARAEGSGLEEQLRELPALRAQAESLRRQTNDLAELRAENRRLRQAFDDKPRPPVQAREEAVVRATGALNWLRAFRAYAEENQGQCPASFEQAAAVYGKKAAESRWDTNAAPEQFEIVFQGSFNSLTNPGDFIVLRERQLWRAAEGRVGRIYGLADGAVQTLWFPQERQGPGGTTIRYDTPEAWEKEHILSGAQQ
jgi:hypothetical protein